MMVTEFSMQAAGEMTIAAAKTAAGEKVDPSEVPEALLDLATKIEAKYQLDRLLAGD